jgi:putative FmdB family regulatory protein
MPTYEYECSQCGQRFEIRQNMNDARIAECPKCNGKAHRLMSAPAGIVKSGVHRDSAIRCGKDTTCCGQQTPCSSRPCDH